jgi:hypothetical protein
MITSVRIAGLVTERLIVNHPVRRAGVLCRYIVSCRNISLIVYGNPVPYACVIKRQRQREIVYFYMKNYPELFAFV